MKIASFVFPHIGGTYTVFRHLRPALAERGVDLRWIGVGARQAARFRADEWREALGYGTMLVPAEENVRLQAAAVIHHLQAERYDAVFVNVLSDRVQTNAIRYLGPHIRRIMIVHNITPGTYAAARSIRDHVDASVGVSPRIRADLTARLGFPPDRTFCIPNAVDLGGPMPPRRIERGPLRLIVLGRMEDASKGILWLPDVLRRLRDVPLTLTIAGDGPDLERLRGRIAGTFRNVTFIGPVPPHRVPAVLASHHVLLFPSRFEGLGISLVEAMATGCVPVASRIRGVTDFVIDHGRTGLLFPVGNMARAADAVRMLAADRRLLAGMSEAARSAVPERFGTEAMAAGYVGVLDTVFAAPPAAARPLSLEDWEFPRGLRSGLRSRLPEPVKNMLRQWRERLA